MLSRISVKKPYTVLVGVVLAIILGIVSFMKMTADLLPNISLPYVIVMTTYPGASPETVEMVVTQPVEASMATVSNIENISSVSNENYSVVILEFAQTADMNAVSLEIRENLDQIKSYWDDSIGNPIIMKLNPDMLPVMIAAVGMEGMTDAEVSAYAKEFIMPELESIEGVASVRATGLLGESVNVIIRQEKIDEINTKVFAAIDEKMKEAEQKLLEGREELEKGEKELENGKKELDSAGKEIANGKKELESGKTQLEKSKEELEAQQKVLSTQLATQKTALQSAKANLENLKTSMTMAKAYDEGIKQMEAAQSTLLSLQGCAIRYNVAAGRMNAALAQLETDPDDAQAQADLAAAKADIAALKNDITTSEILKTVVTQANQGDLLDSLTAQDWENPDEVSAVSGNLNSLELAILAGNVGMEVQKRNVEEQLKGITGGLDYDAYLAQVNTMLAAQGVTDLDKALKDINEGLIKIEEGQIAAAVGFADGKAQISLGQYKMELAEGQLNSGAAEIKAGLEQLEEAKKQLEEARSQLEEGEQQFSEAKEDAYDKADMSKVLTVDTIKGLLTAQNFSMPAGYVTEEGIDYLVRLGDKPATVEELQLLPLMDLHMDGVPVITLGDVADVFYTDNSADIYTNVDGSAGVMLTIQKQTGYSTGQVSDLLLEKFDNLMKEHDGLSMITLMDQGVYIDLVMDSIFGNIIWGFLLAVLILILFLKDLRPTAVVAVSIPISVIAAVVCMYFSGVTLNVISLSGLALGIGMLVDNSIVVIENIYRLRGEGLGVKEAAEQGAKEVAGAILASTLTTVCVFLPIVFTEGITRQLFVDMGLTIAFSLLASLVIALTVVPAMASMVLKTTKEKKEGKLFTGLVNGYEKVLGVCLRIKPVVFLLVLLLLGGSLFLAYQNGTAFMTDMDSTQMTVNVTLDEKATLAETREISDQVAEIIMNLDDVQNVGAMSSSSSLSLLGGGGGSKNAATIYVVTKEDKKMSNEEIADIILEKTAGLDATITVDTSSMDMSALGGSCIAIQVRGREIDELQRIAGEGAEIVSGVEGTADVSDGMKGSEEELRIIIDRDKAVSYGLTVAQVFTQIYGKLADATTATTLVGADKDYNVYVSNGSDADLTRELVKGLSVEGTDKDGAKVEVPLAEIANFETAQTMKAINRVEQTRYISVSAGIADGYNIGLVSNDVEKALASYKMPAGYRLVFSGENEMINDALGQLGLMMVLAIAFMYLIMVAQFQSLKSPFIIMFTIPLAFTGGFLGLFFSGSEISVIAMIGFVMLAGIIVNNGIVLIDYMNQLRDGGMLKKEAIMNAGRTRLRPVLMTALTTIMALCTMVFGNSMGSEMAKPMAVVTIGGLVYGTLLTLIVIPCIYDVFNKDPFVEKVVVVNEVPEAAQPVQAAEGEEE
ncbi:MAG: efflux RND transporter permease subunit [Acetatifactor sp.]|nr:efflux RND transporter permease subunit [Acetatifactor sp.]